MRKLSDIFMAAADHLDRVGFHQGSYFKRDEDRYYTSVEDKTLPCCFLGAVIAVADHDAEFVARQFVHGRDLFPEVDSKLNPIARWNDTEGRTKEEVVAKLRECAKAAEVAGE